MTDAELDTAYTELCHTLSRVGQSRSELALAMLCLGLMAQCDDVHGVLALIAKAEESCIQ